jgi:hypothetical protein
MYCIFTYSSICCIIQHASACLFRHLLIERSFYSPWLILQSFCLDACIWLIIGDGISLLSHFLLCHFILFSTFELPLCDYWMICLDVELGNGVIAWGMGLMSSCNVFYINSNQCYSVDPTRKMFFCSSRLSVVLGHFTCYSFHDGYSLYVVLGAVDVWCRSDLHEVQICVWRKGHSVYQGWIQKWGHKASVEHGNLVSEALVGAKLRQPHWSWKPSCNQLQNLCSNPSLFTKISRLYL